MSYELPDRRRFILLVHNPVPRMSPHHSHLLIDRPYLTNLRIKEVLQQGRPGGVEVEVRVCSHLPFGGEVQLIHARDGLDDARCVGEAQQIIQAARQFRSPLFSAEKLDVSKLSRLVNHVATPRTPELRPRRVSISAEDNLFCFPDLRATRCPRPKR
jgi:hypothetical protein